ncbi:MAG: PEP-utilizing enzyme [Actinomycetota bacterium]
MTSTFAPPGPGEWTLDRSHYPGGVTPISEWLLVDGVERGLRRVFAELGVPAETMDFAFVNGFHYTRLRPLLGGDKPPRRPPPDLLLKVVTRIHPAFRERTRRAAAALRESPAPAVVERWERELRPELLDTNRRLQAVDLDACSDDELQRHVDELLDHLHETFELHFWLHGYDLGPIAQYLDGALVWGLDADDAIAALAGASPTTAAPLEQLCRLRELVEAADDEVDSLDDVRAISAEAAAELDTYLADRGHVLTTGYDLTDSTLIELPDVVLRSIRSARRAPARDERHAASLREQVPAPDRADFDERLALARSVMDLRDGNGPLTVEWPMGLLRLALLAAADRLVERGRIDERDHLLVATPDEASRLFTDGLPASEELAARFERRRADLLITPPPTLGDPEPQPPLELLPAPIADSIRMTQVAIDHIGMGGAPRSGLRGSGIGSAPSRGVACVADSAEDAIRRLDPGQVLVVRATSPAFNSVLAIAGAVVTVDGGVLSHAAVLARELGIPAVVGAPEAMTIPDGATVEVDPVDGEVRILV